MKEKAEWRESDDGITELHTMSVWSMLDTMEEHLKPASEMDQENIFLVNNKYSLADVLATTLLARCVLKRDVDMLQGKPYLTNYWNRIQTRSSFKKA